MNISNIVAWQICLLALAVGHLCLNVLLLTVWWDIFTLNCCVVGCRTGRPVYTVHVSLFAIVNCLLYGVLCYVLPQYGAFIRDGYSVRDSEWNRDWDSSRDWSHYFGLETCLCWLATCLCRLETCLRLDAGRLTDLLRHSSCDAQTHSLFCWWLSLAWLRESITAAAFTAASCTAAQNLVRASLSEIASDHTAYGWMT